MYYTQLSDQQTKIGQHIKKTNFNVLITHLRTLRQVLEFYINYQHINKKFSNLEELLKKLQDDWKVTEYKQEKILNNELELRTNLVYLTYHLQNPQVPLELAYSIYTNKNYNFLPISLNNKYDKLQLYKKAQKINQKYLKMYQNLALKGLFQIQQERFYIFIIKDQLKIKLGISIYNLSNNNQEMIYWIVLGIQYKEQDIENNVQITNILNTVILHFLQIQNEKDLKQINCFFYHFVYYFIKEIFIQEMIQKLYKYSEKENSLIFIQEHTANNTETHKCYKILLDKNIKNKYYFYLINVLDLSQVNSLIKINWMNFDFIGQVRQPFQEIQLKPSINLISLPLNIQKFLKTGKFLFQQIQNCFIEQKIIYLNTDSFNEIVFVEKLYEQFQPIFFFKLYQKLQTLQIESSVFYHNENFTILNDNLRYSNLNEDINNSFYVELKYGNQNFQIQNLETDKICQKNINFQIVCKDENKVQEYKQLKKKLKEIISNNF